MSQPQIGPGEAGTTGANTVRENAAWCQGVGPGYWPTKGSGLTLNLAKGIAFISGAIVTYAGGTLTMVDNTTNYAFLDNAGTPGVNQTGFTSSMIPLATVVTSGGAITSIDDQRTMFFAGGGVTFAGDLSGTLTSQEVVGILNKLIDGGPPTDGQILQYSSATGKWELLVDRPMFPVSAVAGKPGAGQLVCIYTAAVAIAFPANFASPNSYGSLSANPTATATYTVYKNGSTVGTVSISTGGAFTFATTGGVGFTLAAGDRLTIVAPGSQDATLSDVGITLACTRAAAVTGTFTQQIFVWRGAYSGATAYSVNDVVSYEGGVYLCILPSTGNAPTNTTYFALLMGFGYNNRGAYNGATAYVPNDLALSGGTTYLCIAPTTGNAPPNATYWQVLAQAGTLTANDQQQETYVYAADSGAANAYVISLAATPTLIAGSIAVFKAAHTNTGASTLNVNSGGAVAIKKSGTSALAGGEITAGQIIVVVYDGTYWQLVGAGGGGDTGAKYIVGDSPVPSDLANAKSWPGLYNNIDTPPVLPGTLDDEFDGASLDTATRWTWVNQGGAGATLLNSNLVLTAPTSSGDNARIIVQSLPVSGAWEVVVKCWPCWKDTNYKYGGIVVRESSSGKLVTCHWAYVNGEILEYFQHWASPTASGAGSNISLGYGGPVYFKFHDDRTTNFTFSISRDGISYLTIATESRTAYLGTPDQIGVFVGVNDGSNGAKIDFEYFRRTV